MYFFNILVLINFNFIAMKTKKIFAVLALLALAAPGLVAFTSKNEKVVVCHNGKLKSISENAVSSHLAHGDILYTCTPEESGSE